MTNMISNDIQAERILRVRLDRVTDNSSYVEDELPVRWKPESCTPLHIWRYYEDKRRGTCSKIIELSYVEHVTQRSIPPQLSCENGWSKPPKIHLCSLRKVPDDILVRAFHKIFALHYANLPEDLSLVSVLPVSH